MLRGQQTILVCVLWLTYTPGDYSERLRSYLDTLGKLEYLLYLLGVCSVSHIHVQIVHCTCQVSIQGGCNVASMVWGHIHVKARFVFRETVMWPQCSGDSGANLERCSVAQVLYMCTRQISVQRGCSVDLEHFW
jgi:hypothetical protein